MAANILLVVKDQERKAQFLKKMDESGAFCTVVNSLNEAITRASDEPHCGILIDMLLMVRVPAAMKMRVEGLLNGLPSATLNIHASSGQIRILPRGTTGRECSTIEGFVAVSAGFPPKAIYPRKRESLHFNVLLDTAPDFKSADRTVCIDISAGGCFIFSIREDFAVGDTVWLKQAGSGDSFPIQCIVSWIREWGTTQQIPGIGVGFVAISDEIRSMIREMNK